MKVIAPTIYHTKQLIRSFANERKVLLFVDLHGHSQKFNVFLYGCEASSYPQGNLIVRLFPYLLSKTISVISYKDCMFKVLARKNSTARVIIFMDLI
jgi:regulator of sigma D